MITLSGTLYNYDTMKNDYNSWKICFAKSTHLVFKKILKKFLVLKPKLVPSLRVFYKTGSNGNGNEEIIYLSNKEDGEQ